MIRATLLWTLLLATVTRALATPAVFSDPDSTDPWTLSPFGMGDGGTVDTAVETTDGFPASPSRRVRTVVNASPSPSEFSQITGALLDGNAVYDPNPTGQGPFNSIDYFEIARLVQGFGDGQATGVALRQNGNVYIRYVGTTPSSDWTPKEARGVTASGLVLAFEGGTDPGQHPDFSATGAPITFGFFRANSTSPGANGYTTIALIDGWTVLVNPPCATSADCVYPGGCWTGTCDAGTCKATALACDDGDPCTNDGCSAGACIHPAVLCDDGDPCTTDACTPQGCTSAPVSCDDDVACTVDVCTGGTCAHATGFTDVEATIDALLALLQAPPCNADGIAAAARRKLGKKVAQARKKLAAADEATKARLVTKLLGRADHLVDVAKTLVAKAQSHDLITAECAAVVVGFLDDLAMCVDELPHG